MTAAKVILISASPRVGGNCEQVLSACASEIKAAGVAAELICLAGRPIRDCLACPVCFAKGRCVIDDGAIEIYDQIRDAQGLIIASPVYYGTARADALALLHRLGSYNRYHDRFLTGMPGGPIAVARRGGHTATLNQLMMFFQICGLTVPGSVYWNMVFGREKGEALADEEGMNTVLTFARNVAELVKQRV